MQQRDAARQVIEHQQRTRRHVMQCRHAIGGRDPLGQMLEEAHDIVGREAHQAAGQRHAGDLRFGARRGSQRGAQLVQQFRGVGRAAAAAASPTCRPAASSLTSRLSPKPTNE